MEQQYRRVGKGLGITAAVYLGMRYLLPMVLPFLIAWGLVCLIRPWTRRIRKLWHIRQEISGMFLLTLLAGLTVGIGCVLVSRLAAQICSFTSEFDNWVGQAQTLIHNCCCMVERSTGIHAQAAEAYLYDNMELVGKQIKTWSISGVLKNSLGYLVSVLKALGILVVTVISVTFFLKDDQLISEWMEQKSIFRKIRGILSSMQALGGAWIRAQLLIILMVAALCVLGLWLLNYPYALLAGILIGLLDALPFIGTGTILLPWALYQLLIGNTARAVGLGALFFAANTLREYLEPRLIGEKIGIYPVAMMAAVYVGLQIYGAAGVLLGPVSLLLIWELWKELGVL